MNSPTIDYDDVQGTILRGYRVDYARHFIFSIADAKATGGLIGALVNGSDGLPKITTAQRTAGRPDSFLNVSFTCAGLAKMGVSAADLQTFDTSFQLGASNSATAASVGDIGTSAPANWLGGLGDGDQVHLLISLWVRDSEAVLNTVSTTLTDAFAGAATLLLVQDAAALPDDEVHFGYRDSIAQPTVKGAPPGKYPPDDQPSVSTGEFLLGYENEIGGTYKVSPAPLSTNSSYAAFRILEQDSAAFEALLENLAQQTGLDPERVAANICGRWRNGNPLTLAPDSQPVLPTEQLNNFTYVTPPADTDDTLGLRCPIGSHIRRNNPRNAAVVGTDSTHHRIIRRAMPYGTPYDPANPDDGPRGLVGYFVNASVKNQFEFLTSQWNLEPTFVKSAKAPGGTPAGNAVFNISGQDVFLGIDDESTSTFTFAAAGKNGSNNTTATGFGRTITTRGGVYCFFPSMTGLRYLADLPSQVG